MLFFKRLSDVYDEEYEELLKRLGPKLASNPDMYTCFYQPEDCTWNDILSASVNIGEKIIEAARWAPSGANSQPWEFIVVKKQELKDSIARFYMENSVLTHKMELTREPHL